MVLRAALVEKNRMSLKVGALSQRARQTRSLARAGSALAMC